MHGVLCFCDCTTNNIKIKRSIKGAVFFFHFHFSPTELTTVSVVPDVVKLLIFLCKSALKLSSYLLQLRLKSQGFALLMLQRTLVGRKRQSGLIKCLAGRDSV